MLSFQPLYGGTVSRASILQCLSIADVDRLLDRFERLEEVEFALVDDQQNASVWRQRVCNRMPTHRNIVRVVLSLHRPAHSSESTHQDST